MTNTRTEQNPSGGEPQHTAPEPVPSTPISAIEPAVQRVRDGFASGMTRPVEARLAALERLQRGLEQDAHLLVHALRRDLGKAETESVVTELGVVVQELQHQRRNLAGWLKSQRFSPGALLLPAKGELRSEPFGTMLIIAPWNYPVNLSLAPLIGAIAAGNTVVLKPSEISSATSAALAELISRHVDPAWVQVVEGGVEETTELLRLRFDHIVFTGNGTVGRVVARAAAEHLTPTTLELGGKSPVFVDATMDLPAVAKRIAWGKFTNAGQTCVAPDYILGERSVLEALAPHLADAAIALYGADARVSPDYGRIISDKQLQRLTGLLEGQQVIHGGRVVSAERFLEPTIVLDPDPQSPLMQEEIFGPILPLVPVSGVDEAIAFISGRNKPLTLYVFSDDPEVQERFIAETSSGSVALGLTLAHVSAAGMPFGGVGESGMGSYHGEASIRAFSHLKPVMSKPLRPDTLALVKPPYAKKAGLLRRLMGVKLPR